MHDIKSHKWFKDLNWLNVYSRNIQPPFVPICKSSGDASNFDVYDEEALRIASVDLYHREFADF